MQMWTDIHCDLPLLTHVRYPGNNDGRFRLHSILWSFQNLRTRYCSRRSMPTVNDLQSSAQVLTDTDFSPETRSTWRTIAWNSPLAYDVASSRPSNEYPAWQQSSRRNVKRDLRNCGWDWTPISTGKERRENLSGIR
jgi:hypothetical protein